jgi:hypothetical protein
MGHAFEFPLTNEYMGTDSAFLFGIRSFLYKRPGPTRKKWARRKTVSVGLASVSVRPGSPPFVGAATR